MIAGRAIVREEKDGSISYLHKLVRIEEPIMRIPTLAIHLDRFSCCLIYLIIYMVVEWFKTGIAHQILTFIFNFHLQQKLFLVKFLCSLCLVTGALLRVLR